MNNKLLDLQAAASRLTGVASALETLAAAGNAEAVRALTDQARTYAFQFLEAQDALLHEAGAPTGWEIDKALRTIERLG